MNNALVEPSEKHHLPVMSAIERSAEISQRSISEKSGLSLGMVNMVLRDLIHRGWVRAQKVPRKRYMYYLTPQGFSEKTRLALHVFENSLHAYEEARRLMNARAAEFIRQGHKEVALVGAGPKLELAYLACLQVGLKVVGIFDDKTAGTPTLGFDVQKTDQCPEAVPQFLV